MLVGRVGLEVRLPEVRLLIVCWKIGAGARMINGLMEV
jgi:hypothetical protein